MLNVQIKNTSVTPGKNITIGSALVQNQQLMSPNNYLAANGVDENRKIFTIGAAKDMTISGDVTFTNSNNAEDHALVLAAMILSQ